MHRLAIRGGRRLEARPESLVRTIDRNRYAEAFGVAAALIVGGLLTWSAIGKFADPALFRTQIEAYLLSVQENFPSKR